MIDHDLFFACLGYAALISVYVLALYLKNKKTPRFITVKREKKERWRWGDESVSGSAIVTHTYEEKIPIPSRRKIFSNESKELIKKRHEEIKNLYIKKAEAISIINILLKENYISLKQAEEVMIRFGLQHYSTPVFSPPITKIEELDREIARFELQHPPVINYGDFYRYLDELPTTLDNIIATLKKTTLFLKNLHPFTIAASILLLIAPFDLPHAYYTFLRVAVCAYCIFATVRLWGKDSLNIRPLLACAIAILYNPAFPVDLGHREDWLIPNIVSAILTLTFLRLPLNIKKSTDGENNPS